jgi:alkylation response protein AidB-like acyl-CoA dehydrogenase
MPSLAARPCFAGAIRLAVLKLPQRRAGRFSPPYNGKWEDRSMSARTSPPASTAPKDAPPDSFAAEALRIGGKSAEEVQRLGAVDAADERVDALFGKHYQTAHSPVHRAVWERADVVREFDVHRQPCVESEVAAEAMQRSLAVALQHRTAGTLLDEQGKIAPRVLQDLAAAGYWGLLIDREYGGSGASFSQFARFLTRMATIDPTVAGLASVHGCIGAVDPLTTFGSAEQKRRLLPLLATGARLSAFALTEPNAGSDLTALRTVAVRSGDDYLVTGEKLFITNVLPGRMIGIVCLIEGQPAVLIAELPEQETPEFQLRRYGLYALRRAHNYGIRLAGFRVPAANRLQPPAGDGLTIAYHGLNRGRVALCATAAGSMRLMLADLLPWARFRRTYGAAIVTRELVRRRIAHLSGSIVACDALTLWCANLLDEGYRSELECIVAKVFASEAQKEAAVEILMKTHGGRSFLHGHLFGDNVHDFLAPCIYEGEGEMLNLAFFKSLVKEHGRTYFEPLGKALQAAGIKQPRLTNPAHWWALRGPLWSYAQWWLRRRRPYLPPPDFPRLPSEHRQHATFAWRMLQHVGDDISAALRKHQLRLPDRQCRMAELSQRVQTAVVVLCTSLYSGQHADDLVRRAGDHVCRRLIGQLTGRRPSDRDFRQAVELGAAVAEGDSVLLEGVAAGEILMPYPP